MSNGHIITVVARGRGGLGREGTPSEKGGGETDWERKDGGGVCRGASGGMRDTIEWRIILKLIYGAEYPRAPSWFPI